MLEHVFPISFQDLLNRFILRGFPEVHGSPDGKL